MDVNELMLMVGASFPNHIMVRAIREKAENWEKDPSDHNFQVLMAGCMTLLLGQVGKQHSEGINGALKEIRSESALVDLVKTLRN